MYNAPIPTNIISALPTIMASANSVLTKIEVFGFEGGQSYVIEMDRLPVRVTASDKRSKDYGMTIRTSVYFDGQGNETERQNMLERIPAANAVGEITSKEYEGMSYGDRMAFVSGKLAA